MENRPGAARLQLGPGDHVPVPWLASRRVPGTPVRIVTTPSPQYFEDLAVGRRYQGGEEEVTAEESLAFARRYDPQPFHVDPEAAAASVFGGIVASGWLTAALTMRLMVQGEFNFGPGVIGLGVDSLQWPAPVRPGDRLRVTLEVMALRASASRPDFGVVKLRTVTANQRGEPVQVMVSNALVRRRPGVAAAP